MRKKSKAGKKTETASGRPLLHLQQLTDQSVAAGEGSDVELDSDDNRELLAEYGGYVGFLKNLNPTVLERNKAERTQKQQRMTQFVPQPTRDDFAPGGASRDSGSSSGDDGDNASDEGGVGDDDNGDAPFTEGATDEDGEGISDAESDGDDDDVDDDEDADELEELEAAGVRRQWAAAAEDEEAVARRAPPRLPTIRDGRVIRAEDARSAAPPLPGEELRRAKERVAERKQKQAEAASGVRAKAKRSEATKASPGEDVVEGKPEPKKKKLTAEEKARARVVAQERMAELASEILSGPAEKLAELKQLRELTSAARDAKVVELGLLSQAAVYRDILPGYRVRDSTASERALWSKEVRQQRTYEARLVACYQAYLQQLEAAAGSPDGGVALAATRCMGELLVGLAHFNFRVNLMGAVVQAMGNRREEVSQAACAAMARLFAGDVSGEYSAEGTKLISRLVRGKGCRVRAAVLRTFLRLRLREEVTLEDLRSAKKGSGGGDGGTEDGGKGGKGGRRRKREEKQPYVSKKRRKVEKKDDDLEREMKEAEAEYTREERVKWHSESLKHVFTTYFRVLKHGSAAATALLPVALEGLSRFAHLIDVDFFSDLLAVLREICAAQQRVLAGGGGDADDETAAAGGNGRTAARTALHCIVTALRLLSGPGEALNLDPKEFGVALYGLLAQLPARGEATCDAVADEGGGDGGESSAAAGPTAGFGRAAPAAGWGMTPAVRR
ncbi:Nucleolar complex protein 3, partial [Cladochytrium tenue]